MEKAIAYAHTYGVKVYVTVNTLIYLREKEACLKHIARVCELGADALIMQDMGMVDQVRQRWPDMPIHASTQMHNHNDAALEYVRSLGAVRAVLAREMTLEQIRSLRSPIEKEVFVHGARFRRRGAICSRPRISRCWRISARCWTRA
jgi:putative protease